MLWPAHQPRDNRLAASGAVLAVALNTAGNPDGARAALDDARRIRPRLAPADIARFASPEEMAGLGRAGLL